MNEIPQAISVNPRNGQVDAIASAVRRVEANQTNLMWTLVTVGLLGLASVVMLVVWEVRYQTLKAKVMEAKYEIQQMVKP